jgi:hypothetical protein
MNIDRVTVKLLKGLKVERLNEVKDKLLDIAEDGVISDDEKPDMYNNGACTAEGSYRSTEHICVTKQRLKSCPLRIVRGEQIER